VFGPELEWEGYDPILISLNEIVTVSVSLRSGMTLFFIWLEGLRG
jgi:hypothetical protein